MNFESLVRTVNCQVDPVIRDAYIVRLVVSFWTRSFEVVTRFDQVWGFILIEIKYVIAAKIVLPMTKYGILIKHIQPRTPVCSQIYEVLILVLIY